MMSAIAATTADVQPLSRTSIGLSSSGADPHQLRYRCRSRSYLSRVRLARLRRRPVAAAVTPGPTHQISSAQAHNIAMRFVPSSLKSVQSPKSAQNAVNDRQLDAPPVRFGDEAIEVSEVTVALEVADAVPGSCRGTNGDRSDR